MTSKVVLVVLLLHSILQQCLSYGNDNPSAHQLLEYWKKTPIPPYFATSSGAPVADPGNVETVGKRGPVPMKDTVLFDTLSHFDKERIPERVVHAKGGGAWGHFMVTNTDVTKYSKAKLFSEVGKSTPVFVRFSRVSGELGAADTVREFRGFAIKFYTEEGNLDVVGFNFPIFLIREPLLFPSLTHVIKRNPVTNLRDFTMFWDFMSQVPSTTLAILMVSTSLGIPRSFRKMNGFGVNTYVLENDNGEYVFAKFHFLSNQGIENFDSQEAVKVAGTEPDYNIKDLYNAIHKGAYPSWNVSVQIMTPSQAKKFPWNYLDVTKFWPENIIPLIPIGILTLNYNPTNYFAEVEQSAFHPNNLVPGIRASFDRIFQGRLFSYSDTQVYRVGVNHKLYRVNYPHGVPSVANIQRDGEHRSDDNQGGSPNYFPNSFGGPVDNPRGDQISMPVHGNVTWYDTKDDDNYSQPAMFWKSLDEKEKRNVVENIAATLKLAKEFIQKRIIYNYHQVDEGFAKALQAELAR